MPVAVYEDVFEGMPWVPSGRMGNVNALTLDGSHTDNPHEGEACIRMSYEGRYGWVGVAWQHPANNWGDLDGGFDITGAAALEFWARGEKGGEKINVGVGLAGSRKAYPDSGRKKVDGIKLRQEWQRYRISLEKVDLSSIKTGFVVFTEGGRKPVTIYLDSIRFIK